MNQEPTLIVTGGAQGIGKAIALKFLRNGYSVVIGDIDDEAGRETVHDFSNSGLIRFQQTDVAEELSVKNLVEFTVSLTGRIDALVNNAGIASPASGPVEDLDLADWNRVIGVNLTGAFLCTKYSVPHLRKTSGSIVNVSSTRALQSEADTEAYSASKGGITALTHALALSLGPRIRVNCISPGWIDVTSWKKQSVRKSQSFSDADHLQHPVGRIGKPEDVAEMALFLCSENAGFVTGQNFVVDGGMTKKMIYVE